MAWVEAGDQRRRASLVAFDKDGTLVDIHRSWGARVELWAGKLAGHAEERSRLWACLCALLGYDPQAGRILSAGALARGTNAELVTLAAGCLHREGLDWEEARRQAAETFASLREELPAGDRVPPLEGVVEALGALRAAGLLLAVVTTDDQQDAEADLKALGLRPQVAAVVGGDQGLAPKPHADMLLAACSRLGVPPQRAVVVGDTPVDLLMARRAGAALAVGVLSGVSSREELAGHADVVLERVDELRAHAE